MKVRLKSLEIAEKSEKYLEMDFSNLSIGDFNLLISDNAQGKTRLLKHLNFLSSLYKDNRIIIPTTYYTKIAFEIINQKKSAEVTYEINIKPVNGENHYSELVVKEGKTIYSAVERLLFNETSGEEIKNYFIPKNLPALASINEPDFITLNLIRDFFQRIVYLSANKSRVVTVTPDALIPDTESRNIASVLENWREKYPEKFNEVLNELKRCFPFINKVFFTKRHIQGIGKADLLTFNEDNINKPIMQHEWSDGIYRILYLIMAPQIPFTIGSQVVPPSLILVDEIENGLDFKSLKYIINYFKDYSDESQIIISSHSPLVCDFVHPENWIIVKRKGAKLSFISPKAKEKDLDSQLDIFKQKHWDFYTKHISNSEKYKI